MNIRNNLRRVVTTAVTAAAIGVGATGVASASTAQPAAVTSMSHQAAPTASAAGDFGPDTCLQGWVWRDARPGNHVCVTPATRSQAAADNALAASRRQPGGGPYGPDTCIQGYVWREAFPGNHVCVTPATRSQAAADNAQAANRQASLKIWLTEYVPSTCGDGCTTNPAPLIKVNGDHFNVNSQVKIVARWSGSNTLIGAYTVTARNYPGFVGGSFGERTGLLPCTGKSNAYFQAYNFVSQRWSERLPFTTGCATL